MKKHLGLIMTICAMVLCLLNIVGFFIPTTTYKEDTSIKLSSMEIAFTSKKTAEKKSSELQAELQADVAGGKYTVGSDQYVATLRKIQKYSIIAQLKTEEDTKTDANFAAITHFISVVLSLGLLAALIASLFGKACPWVTRGLALAAFAFILASMISYICLLNSSISMGPVAVKVSKLFKVGAGIILSVIGGTLAVCPTFIPYKTAKSDENN